MPKRLGFWPSQRKILPDVWAHLKVKHDWAHALVYWTADKSFESALNNLFYFPPQEERCIILLSLFEVLNIFVSLKRLIGIIVHEDSSTVGYYDML